ncbi:monoacylglycerol lipase ABHD2-like isoform X2 [Rhinoraja longicauda]
MADSESVRIAPEMPAMFDGMKLAAVAAVLYIIVRCLNLKSPTASPELTFQDTPLTRFLLKSCPLLTKEYIPPLIWGKSGHVQTALYGKMGRVSSPHPYGQRKYLPMSDGATATWDLFEPMAEHNTGEDITMVICPGIANHSEKQYIRTFVDYAQKNGYRSAVLNHLGALPNIELTSPRMFTYGCTWEFGAMVNSIKKAFPQTQLVVVGFSLGGNIVCKFLGEDQVNQENVLCCISVCQGYSALRKILFGENGCKSPNALADVDLSKLYTATSLMHIDDNIMRKFHGYDTLKEYYEQESCMHYLHNIQIPLLLVNAQDDPLVHDSLLSIPRSLAEKKENVMFVLTLHGGHLGFFEGAVLFPKPLTWMDKLILEYANAICHWEKNKPQCTTSADQNCSDHSE